MIPHVYDVLETGPDDKWLIVGKGPSFNADIVDGFGGKACSLNDACNGTVEPHLTVCNDWRSIQKLSRCSRIAVPVYHHDFVPDEEHQLPFLIDALGYAPWSSLCLFDLRTTSRKPLFPQYPIVQAYDSSFETALILLAYKGVKDVYTVGVDGGTEYHPSFGKRTYPCTLDGQFANALKTATANQMNVRKLSMYSGIYGDEIVEEPLFK